MKESLTGAGVGGHSLETIPLKKTPSMPVSTLLLQGILAGSVHPNCSDLITAGARPCHAWMGQSCHGSASDFIYLE